MTLITLFGNALNLIGALTTSEDDSGFATTAVAFLANMEWLRSGWTALGDEYEARPSPEVIELVHTKKCC